MSDSIATHVWGIEGVLVQSFSGDTIATTAHKVDSGRASLNNFDYVIFHTGTNDIDKKASFHDMTSDYENLVGICRKKKPQINIIISAIIPRPKDHENTDNPIKRINSYLEKVMAKSLNFKFIKTYRPFMYEGKPKHELFAKRDRGLHLNTEGTSRLRFYFLRTIASM